MQKKRKALIEVETQEKVGKYVYWKQVIPERCDGELNSVGLNLKLAAKLEEALKFTSSRLQFKEKNQAIKITSSEECVADENSVYGIIMPVMLE